MHPLMIGVLAAERIRKLRAEAATAQLAGRARDGTATTTYCSGNGRPHPRGRAVFDALGPLLFDAAIPTGLYYALTGLGVGNTAALVAAGLIPFARAARSLVSSRRPDYLAVMMTSLFVLSLGLVAVSGSPKFILVKESFGTALLGLWSLGSAVTRRPMTFYTARPILTRGDPDALAIWDRLADESPRFRRVQRRLAVVWGAGLLTDAAVRVAIVQRYPVHTAAGLVNVAAVLIVIALCVLTGPLGGLQLQRLLIAGSHRAAASPSACGDPSTSVRRSSR